MMDVVSIGLTLMAFALAQVYIAGCNRLRGGRA